ncbi:hypothetical protein [Massilia sp. H6]|uniref:hypothetical protein n=1 Tax=Massilia sp. H6 TaxID=2970464 RepID=UPI002166CF3B|nr:hypothetical protein [Massilia sp. H6]UVW29508.1 hypothetical protein NRS07_05095 [Massilia sp. H6]
MKHSLARLAVLAVCLALSRPALAQDEADALTLAARFMDALKQQRYHDAAALFVAGPGNDLAACHVQRIGEQIGGLSAIRNVLSMPAGTSVKFAVPPGDTLLVNSKKFFRINYTATASDGEPVWYVVDVDGERQPLRVLSFAVHLPTPDAEAAQRARRVVSTLACATP